MWVMNVRIGTNRASLISKLTAGTLSGGEQQMLAISRTLMLRPKLLLLEPSFGLAPRRGSKAVTAGID